MFYLSQIWGKLCRIL